MSMRMHLLVIGLVGPLTLLSAISRGADAQSIGLPEEARKIISGATRVECFRIDPRIAEKGGQERDAKFIDGYPITSTGKERGRDFAEKLAAALTDEKSYGGPARCFFPGVGFRAWNGEESVDVIICYLCSNFYVVACDADGKAVARSELAGFQGNWTAFVELAKSAFPDDAAIQELEVSGTRGGGERKTGL